MGKNLSLKTYLQRLGKKGDSEENEIKMFGADASVAWENILLQIALPVILILAFVAINKLKQYREEILEIQEVSKERLRELEQKEITLQKMLEEKKLLEKSEVKEDPEPEKEAIPLKNYRVIPIQFQKPLIIRALESFRYNKKLEFGLYLSSAKFLKSKTAWQFETYLNRESAQNIKMEAWKLDDPFWKEKFSDLFNILKEERTRNNFAYIFYNQILDLTEIEIEEGGQVKKVKIQDPYSQDQKTFFEKLQAQPEILDPMKELSSSEEINITDENRDFLWKHIRNDFLKEVENDTVILQRYLLSRIIDYFIFNPQKLETIETVDIQYVRELQSYMQKFTIASEEEQKLLKEKISRAIENFSYEDLSLRGYNFLPRTWKYIGSK